MDVKVKVISGYQNQRKNLVSAKIIEKGNLEGSKLSMWLGRSNEDWKGHPVREGDILTASYREKDEIDEEYLVYNDLDESLFKHIQRMGNATGYSLTKDDITPEMLDSLKESLIDWINEYTYGHLNLSKPFIPYEVGDKFDVKGVEYQLIELAEIDRYGLLNINTASAELMSGCDSESIDTFVFTARQHFARTGDGMQRVAADKKEMGAV
ncbi:hypothetical protein CN918_29390 [Priestia megaterium]|nr:hypothetical protein CN918_29390 [Priestia megaterium]